MNNNNEPIPEDYHLKDTVSRYVNDKNRDKFCLLPWLNIHTNPDGKIKLCCNVYLDHFIGGHTVDGDLDTWYLFNLGYHDIDLIWNDKYMRNARVLSHANEPSGECHGCYNLEKSTGHSPRIGQNQLWLERQHTDTKLQKYLIKSLNSNIGETKVSMLPVSLELRLGNQCNLQCITCWGMSSSLIHDERKEILDSGILEEKNMIWLKDKWSSDEALVSNTNLKEWFETDMFYSNFKKMAPNLKRLYTTGGEPTVIKSNYKMFQMLLDEGNTDCRIEFTTNMTTWNKEFYKRLEQFKNVEIQMSIDGVDYIGEYIRYPSEFPKVLKNIRKAAELVSTRPGWTLKCYTVLQALNCQHIGPIWDLLSDVCDEYGINIDWWPITLTAPEYLSVAAVPGDIRQTLAYKLGEKRNQYREDLDSFYIGHHTWTTLYDSLVNIEYNADLNSKLKSIVLLNDEVRQVDGEIMFADIINV